MTGLHFMFAHQILSATVTTFHQFGSTWHVTTWLGQLQCSGRSVFIRTPHKSEAPRVARLSAQKPPALCFAGQSEKIADLLWQLVHLW